jgi:hypothetical protein
MSEKATPSKPTVACPAPLVLFGIDSRGKPKAARFGKQHAGLALKAATQLQLQVLTSNDPKIADLAAQVPVGRVHATGRTFVPFIRRERSLASRSTIRCHCNSGPRQDFAAAPRSAAASLYRGFAVKIDLRSP